MFKLIATFLTGSPARSDIRETERQIYAMSESDLRDIGITRGDIHAVARGAVRTC